MIEVILIASDIKSKLRMDLEVEKPRVNHVPSHVSYFYLCAYWKMKLTNTYL